MHVEEHPARRPRFDVLREPRHALRDRHRDVQVGQRVDDRLGLRGHLVVAARGRPRPSRRPRARTRPRSPSRELAPARAMPTIQQRSTFATCLISPARFSALTLGADVACSRSSPKTAAFNASRCAARNVSRPSRSSFTGRASATSRLLLLLLVDNRSLVVRKLAIFWPVCVRRCAT